jgi:hypothetical protein
MGRITSNSLVLCLITLSFASFDSLSGNYQKQMKMQILMEKKSIGKLQ